MPDSQQTLEHKAASEPEPSGDKCLFCHSRQFRRSRLHMDDLFTLLRMRVPARCLRCGQLQTISFSTARTALPAGSGSGPTHEVQLPEPVQRMAAPVQQTQLFRPAPPARSAPAVAMSDSGVRAQAQAVDRSAVPHAVLLDALDIRCQYCPGQSFRRSRLRLEDVFLLLMLRYSARCLRCGQRQVVSFMVAASGVPSSYKQARNLRNTETWGEFTSQGAPPVSRVKPAKPLQPVIGQVYTLKDIPMGYDMPLPTTVTEETMPKENAPKAAVTPGGPGKRRSDDQAIW